MAVHFREGDFSCADRGLKVERTDPFRKWDDM